MSAIFFIWSLLSWWTTALLRQLCKKYLPCCRRLRHLRRHRHHRRRCCFCCAAAAAAVLLLSGVVASARLCCLSRVPPAVCPSLLESATTVCASFKQSISTYVHTPTPHSMLRFRPAPQTPDLHTSNLPHVVDQSVPTRLAYNIMFHSVCSGALWRGLRHVLSCLLRHQSVGLLVKG